MIDEPGVIRAFLAGQSAISDLVGSRLYAETDVPPEGYRPAQGSALVLLVRGGEALGEQRAALLRPSVQVKCYGGGGSAWEQRRSARALYRALFDVLEDARDGTVLGATLEVGGQMLAEPDTGWPFVLAFWEFTVRNP